MIKPSIDELLEVMNDRYSLVIAASKRARQIIESETAVEKYIDDKPVTVAVKEIMEGKVRRVISE
jgi:DNA-directed RNA polymerase subunit omega